MENENHILNRRKDSTLILTLIPQTSIKINVEKFYL